MGRPRDVFLRPLTSMIGKEQASVCCFPFLFPAEVSVPLCSRQCRLCVKTKFGIVMTPCSSELPCNPCNTVSTYQIFECSSCRFVLHSVSLTLDRPAEWPWTTAGTWLVDPEVRKSVNPRVRSGHVPMKYSGE